MGINQAQDRPERALVNQLKQLQHDFDEFRTTPQQIGNGSINYALFSELTAGPFTIPAGAMASLSVIFAPIASPFTYNGKDAINRQTLGDLYWTVMVDVNDADHAIPYGAALVGPERRAFTCDRSDYFMSGLSDNNGQMYKLLQITNMDTATHNYWLAARMLIPRPALKPQ